MTTTIVEACGNKTARGKESCIEVDKVLQDDRSLENEPLQLKVFAERPKFTDGFAEREYLKGRLAAAFRIFGDRGYDEGIAGHITLRDPILKDCFWVNPFGKPFSLIKRSDLILVNEEGKVIDGGPNRNLNAAAFMIHSAIHKARPDVHAAAHCHSTHGKSFSTLGRNIDFITQDSCVFYNDIALYESFRGAVVRKKEGEEIAKCLGNKKAVILQNHGLLTVGHSIEETIFWFVSLDKTCYAQLLADAAASGRSHETVKIDQEDAQFTYNLVGSHDAGYFSGLPLFEEIAEKSSHAYLN